MSGGIRVLVDGDRPSGVETWVVCTPDVGTPARSCHWKALRFYVHETAAREHHARREPLGSAVIRMDAVKLVERYPRS